MPGAGKPVRLIIEADGRRYVRAVAGPTALVTHLPQGTAAEQATRSAVARWGLRDLVFEANERAVGSGTRELGDSIVVAGPVAAVVQVKSRAAPSADVEREAAWIHKHVAKARRQAGGTIRALRGRDTTLHNLRGRAVQIDGRRFEWLAVVVVDHENAPLDLLPDAGNGEIPCVVLLRRDWEFLFEQLRSTRGVVDYIRRVAKYEPVALGREAIRYYELADADEKAAPSPVESTLARHGRHVSTPLLPKRPAGSDVPDVMVRIVLEDLAISPADFSEDVRLQVLGEIDSIPVGARTELGSLLLDMVETADDTPSESTFWQFRFMQLTRPAPMLAFGVCSRLDDLTREAFRQYALLRHHQFADDLVTVAVMLTPRKDGMRPWDTTMFRIEGELSLTDEEVNRIAALFPLPADGRDE